MVQLIGIAIFLIVTSLTYYTVTPVTDTANKTQVDATNASSSMTANTTGDNSLVTNVYRIITSIATGGVISFIAVFFIRSSRIEILFKQNSAGYNR